MPPFSCQRDDTEQLLKALVLHGLALGQWDQEHLVRALGRRLEEACRDRTPLRAWLRAATIDLSPCQHDRHVFGDQGIGGISRSRMP